jgi:hypothetical protein
MSVELLMSIQAKVESRIKYIQKGFPFSTNSFYKLGSCLAVQKALSRLAAQGTITRVNRGIYCRPKPLKSIPSITTTVSAVDIARLWARQHNYKLVTHGLEEAYKLGFQTQAPIIKLYWTNGPSREFAVGKQRVKVVHANSELLRWGNEPEGRLLRALSVFRKYELPSGAFKIAFSRLQVDEITGQKLVCKIRNGVRSNHLLPNLNMLE